MADDSALELLTPQEDAALRAAGFVPASWWHPTKHIIVEDEYGQSPRFTVVANGRDVEGRFTADEVTAIAAASPDVPG